MSANPLMENVKVDTVGKEIAMRVVGNREPPARMSIQIDVTGTATVQIQARVSRSAPWVDLGTAKRASDLTFIDPIPFLRAITTGTGPESSVSVWALWGW